MIQAPRWLPYRLRARWDEARIRAAVRGLERTAPLPARAPAQAAAEVHMLLCRRDVRLGVLALKSLLRFPDAQFAVTLSDDGSLSAAARAWVDRHVPGCRWVPRYSHDPRLTAALGSRPRLAELYRGSYHPICKLLHAAVLGRCERVIVVDPDTAFFRRPERLTAWAQGPGVPAWFLHDHQNEALNVPAETREAFAELQHLLTPAGRSWSMPYYFFNSGLLAYRPDRVDLDLGERYLAWRCTAAPRYRTGKPDLWFGDWTPEQTMYQVMFALMDPAAQPLGDDYHLGGDDGHTFNHFLRFYLVRERSLVMLRQLAAALPAADRAG
jgi:hypothetical protein